MDKVAQNLWVWEKRVIIIINSLQIKIIIFFGLQNVIDEIFNKWTTQCSTSGPFLDSFMVGEGWLQSSQDLDASKAETIKKRVEGKLNIYLVHLFCKKNYMEKIIFFKSKFLLFIITLKNKKILVDLYIYI